MVCVLLTTVGMILFVFLLSTTRSIIIRLVEGNLGRDQTGTLDWPGGSLRKPAIWPSTWASAPRISPGHPKMPIHTLSVCGPLQSPEGPDQKGTCTFGGLSGKVWPRTGPSPSGQEEDQVAAVPSHFRSWPSYGWTRSCATQG